MLLVVTCDVTPHNFYTFIELFVCIQIQLDRIQTCHEQFSFVMGTWRIGAACVLENTFNHSSKIAHLFISMERIRPDVKFLVGH
jgi:hypothetical protein